MGAGAALLESPSQVWMLWPSAETVRNGIPPLPRQGDVGTQCFPGLHTARINLYAICLGQNVPIQATLAQ